MLGQRAVVIGGSIAGLSAARALADYFQEVIVVERDSNPNTPHPRKAVPQGHHAHALLKSGEKALDSLFPGITEELVSCGAHQIDFSKDVRWYHGGAWKMRYESGFKVMIQSRPLLELVLRNRVQSLPNVEFLYGYEVFELCTSADNSKITGVHLQNLENRSKQVALDADLLVDASGRGSKTPQWLEAMGYSQPEETTLKIDLSYASRLYEAPEGQSFDWKLLVMNPAAPDVLRAGYIFPVENNRWLVTFGGYSGDKVPHDDESFVEYAKGLAQPDIYNILQTLKPLGDVKVYNIPQTVRRHYEKMGRFPSGLIVMGDAFCAFDPVFGQGMSAGAKEAVALRELLAKETAATLPTFAQRFHKRAAQVVEVAWMLACAEDFRYPKTSGKKPFGLPVLHWYSNHIFKLSATDREVFESFRQVMHLLAGIEALFKPTVVFKVLRHALTGA